MALWAGVIELIALGLEIAAGLALGAFWTAWIAPILSAVAIIFQSLFIAMGGFAIVAGIVASKFGMQGSKHVKTDWDRSALSNFKTDIDNTIIVGTIVVSLIGTAKAALKTVFLTPVGAFLKGIAPSIARNLAIFDTVTADAFGGASFTTEADYWIDRMNSDLGYI